MLDTHIGCSFLLRWFQLTSRLFALHTFFLPCPVRNMESSTIPKSLEEEEGRGPDLKRGRVDEEEEETPSKKLVGPAGATTLDSL